MHSTSQVRPSYHNCECPRSPVPLGQACGCHFPLVEVPGHLSGRPLATVCLASLHTVRTAPIGTISVLGLITLSACDGGGGELRPPVPMASGPAAAVARTRRHHRSNVEPVAARRHGHRPGRVPANRAVGPSTKSSDRQHDPMPPPRTRVHSLYGEGALPHGGRCEIVAEACEFAVNAVAAPCRVLGAPEMSPTGSS